MTYAQIAAERIQLKKLRETKLEYLDKLKEARDDAPNKAAKQKLLAHINTQIQALRHIESRLSVLKTEAGVANQIRWKRSQFAQGFAVGAMVMWCLLWIQANFPF